MADPDEFITESQVWRLQSIDTMLYEQHYETEPSYQNYSHCRFTLRMSRKFEFYVMNTLLPCICLVCLQVSTLMLPPRLPDRSVFSISVVLAFAILQTIINEQIPTTSDIILIVVYISCQLVFGTSITIYSLITCQLERTTYFQERRKLAVFANFPKLSFRISLIRLFDILIFVISVLALLLIHAIIFYQMTTR